MIVLDYACKTCAFKTGILDAAQAHSNTTRHHVKVEGFMTPNMEMKKTTLSEQDKKNAAFIRSREAEIMRAARDRGLLNKK